ncbi:MAG: OmpA family protein [Alphaproteobacteria bacterium]
MKHRNLWLGTAIAGLLIGISSHAVAEYKYLRSPAIEEKATESKSSEDMPSEADTPEPKAPVALPPVPPKAPNKPSLTVTNEPAPAKKPSFRVVNEPVPAKPKPSMEITSKPVPAPVAAPVVAAKPAPAPAGNAIISQPPKMEAPVVAPQHRDITKMPPIISNPPDAKAPPVVQGTMAPAAAPAAGSASAPEPAAMPAVPAPAVVSVPETPVAAPTPRDTDKTPIISNPPDTKTTPPIQGRYAPAASSAVASAPSAPTGEQRPVSNPLPDITVVHEADNPEVSDPAPVAQPAPRPRGPREEPPTLPQSAKPGHSTVDSIPAFAQAARPVPTADPAPETSASPPPQFESSSAAAPVAALPATPAPPEEVSMPAVPTMADLTLAFPGNSSDLTVEAQKKLDAVIRQLKDMGEGRLQVRGFATGEDGGKPSARRIALSRALSVRSYLMDKGIKATRVDVRAMGSETERSPLDRVDLIFAR